MDINNQGAGRHGGGSKFDFSKWTGKWDSESGTEIHTDR